MDLDRLRELAARQCDMVSRRQLRECGARDFDVARLVRQRRLARVVDGVFALHTGQLSRAQREWSVLLRHEPAALAGASALAAWNVRGPWGGGALGSGGVFGGGGVFGSGSVFGSGGAFGSGGVFGSGPTGRSFGRGNDPPVHIVVDSGRRLCRVPGTLITRTQHFERIARLDLAPPRVVLEVAALGAASLAATDSSRVAILADVCQQRRTTPERLAGWLETLPRLKHRAFMAEVLADVDQGAFSVLERRYLGQVERAHGLPRAERQLGVAGAAGPGRRGTGWRDVDYRAYGLVVELDGRLGHEWTTERWDDMSRDVATALRQEITLRVGWQQVLDPCRLATSVATILVARGWSGWLRSCGADCRAQRQHEGGVRPSRGA